jgi:hypothetical protein
MATKQFLPLPGEVLLNVAARLVNDPKLLCSNCDVISFGLVCRCFTPIAQEVLCQTIVLDSAKVNGLLRFLFKYPRLAFKVKSLEIKSTSTRSDDLMGFNHHEIHMPPNIPKLKGQFLQDCVRTVHESPFDDNTKREWIANLKTTDSLTHAPLLCLLLFMVSNVEELYLGGCKLYDVPFLWDILAIFVDVAIRKQLSGMRCILPALGSKLKILELPNITSFTVTRFRPRKDTLGPFAAHFLCLKTLIIPEDKLGYPYMDRDDGSYRYVPASLERLIVVDSVDGARHPKLRVMILNKDLHYPLLKEIKVFGCFDFLVPRPWKGDKYKTIHQVAAEAQITYTEVSPKNFKHPSDTLPQHINNHIWRYTTEEIEQFE